MNCNQTSIQNCLYNIPKLKSVRCIPQEAVTAVVYLASGKVQITTDAAYSWTDIPTDSGEITLTDKGEGLYEINVSVDVRQDNQTVFQTAEVISAPHARWFVEVETVAGQKHGIQYAQGGRSYQRNNDGVALTLTFSHTGEGNFFFYDIIDDQSVSYTYSRPSFSTSAWHCYSKTQIICGYVLMTPSGLITPTRGYKYVEQTVLPAGIEWLGTYTECSVFGGISTCADQQNVPALDCDGSGDTTIYLSTNNVTLSSNSGCMQTASVYVQSSVEWTYNVVSGDWLTVSQNGNTLQITLQQEWNGADMVSEINVSNGYDQKVIIVYKRRLMFLTSLGTLKESLTFNIPYTQTSQVVTLSSVIGISDIIVYSVSSSWITVTALDNNSYQISATQNNSTLFARQGTVMFYVLNPTTGDSECYTATATVVQDPYTEAPVKSITITGTNEMCVSSTQQLGLIFNNMAVERGLWTSSDTTVQTVSPTTGLLTSKTVVGGITYIQFTSSTNVQSALFKVTVISCGTPPDPGYAVRITGGDTVAVGGTLQLGYETTCSDTSVTWGLMDESCVDATISSTGLITVPASSSAGCSGTLTVTLRSATSCNFDTVYKEITITGGYTPTSSTCGKTGKCLLMSGAGDMNRGESSTYYIAGKSNCINTTVSNQYYWTLTTTDEALPISTTTPSGSKVLPPFNNIYHATVTVSQYETSEYLFVKCLRRNYSTATYNFFGCMIINVHDTVVPNDVNCNFPANVNMLYCNVFNPIYGVNWNVGQHNFDNISAPYSYSYSNNYITFNVNYYPMQGQSNIAINVNFGLCGDLQSRQYKIYSRYITVTGVPDVTNIPFTNGYVNFDAGDYGGTFPNSINLTAKSGNGVPQSLVSSTGLNYTAYNYTGYRNYVLTNFTNNSYINFRNCDNSGYVNFRFYNITPPAPAVNYYMAYYYPCNGTVVQNKQVYFYANNVLDYTNSGLNAFYTRTGTNYFDSVGNKTEVLGTINKSDFYLNLDNTFCVRIYNNLSLQITVTLNLAYNEQVQGFPHAYTNNLTCNDQQHSFNLIPVKNNAHFYYTNGANADAYFNSVVPNYVTAYNGNNIVYNLTSISTNPIPPVLLTNYNIAYRYPCNNYTIQNRRVSFFTNNLLIDYANSDNRQMYNVTGSNYMENLGNMLKINYPYIYPNSFYNNSGNTLYVRIYNNQKTQICVTLNLACNVQLFGYPEKYTNDTTCNTASLNYNLIGIKSNQHFFFTGNSANADAFFNSVVPNYVMQTNNSTIYYNLTSIKHNDTTLVHLYSTYNNDLLCNYIPSSKMIQNGMYATTLVNLDMLNIDWDGCSGSIFIDQHQYWNDVNNVLCNSQYAGNDTRINSVYLACGIIPLKINYTNTNWYSETKCFQWAPGYYDCPTSNSFDYMNNFIYYYPSTQWIRINNVSYPVYMPGQTNTYIVLNDEDSRITTTYLLYMVDRTCKQIRTDGNLLPVGSRLVILNNKNIAPS